MIPVVQFYKIELGIPDGNNVNWVTLGETHNTPVVNGTLEMLHADGLPPAFITCASLLSKTATTWASHTPSKSPSSHRSGGAQINSWQGRL
ncbi:MAG: hypothetical protein H6665_07710 [Ardenticatenaceae bacterium]|nr:hypothetical protein [Ardenticatenaceae bacterium]